MRLVAAFLLLFWLLATNVSAQVVKRWKRNLDDAGHANDIGSVLLLQDTTYTCISRSSFVQPGRLRWYRISSNGSIISSSVLEDTLYTYVSGLGHSLMDRPDGSIWYAGSRLPFDGSEPDGILFCYTAAGDTCWTRVFGGTAFEVFNGAATASDGGALLVGARHLTQTDIYAVRVDTNGDSLWTRTYGAAGTTEYGMGVRPTLDNGFIVSGYKVLAGNNYDMYVLKLDSLGNQQWQHNYGSPWSDNAGFAEQLPDGRFVLAGGQRPSSTEADRPVFYLLNSAGVELWHVLLDDGPEFSVFFTVPLLMADAGYVIAGGSSIGSQEQAMLVRLDSAGSLVWRRHYTNNTVTDHYFYDLRRTLDGGFIMAGTAFATLPVSQDAWLVKVDSFGCLVPGCQVFDGLQEQFTDLGEALQVYPNPARDHVQVQVELPPGFAVQGPLQVGLVSADGRLVQQQTLGALPPGQQVLHTLPLTGLSAGLYHLHLTDGNRWLSGTRLIVE
ncbi:MAG: T9SS type A sorting domain-containing protein [Flavobacteriales bacterium]|nr:T9SS type A sorting domain-containing protein [Flavobacteriales bacterium]